MNDLCSASSSSIYQERCFLHPANDIIYYCTSVYCEKTLCFECLKEHSNIHKSNKTSQNLITLSQLKADSQEKISKNLETLLEEIKSIENHYLYHYESILKDYSENLFQARFNIDMIIKNFFDNIEFKIKNTLLEIYEKNYPFILKSLEEFKRFIAKLSEHKSRLDGPVNLSYLLGLNFENLNEECEKIKKESYSQLQKLSRKALIIKDEIFTKIMNIMSEEIRYECVPDVSFIQDQLLYYSDLELKQLNPQKPLVLEELRISSTNYFANDCKHKVLHFFQDNTKLLRIIDVESLNNSISKSYHVFEIPLNIPFEIPAWHKSVITKEGDIYLVGGINVQDGNKEMKNVYRFDYEDLTLEEYPPMLKERYGHELCLVDDNLYIMGGSNDAEGMLVFCERYDLSTRTSFEIAPLKIKTCCGCSCLYNKETIYLFGGLLEDKVLNDCIQKYEILKDIWQIIKFDAEKEDPFQILWCSSAVQINNSQILIFGGYKAENEGCRSTLILDIQKKEGKENTEKGEMSQESYRISRNNLFDLPYGEGFWNNQAIVQRGKVFSLQNIQNEDDSFETQLNMRRVMSFTGRKWTIFQKKT